MTQQPHVSARAVTPAATPMVQPLFSPPASSATLGVFGRGTAPPERPLCRVLGGLCKGGSTTIAEVCFFDLTGANDRTASATS